MNRSLLLLLTLGSLTLPFGCRTAPAAAPLAPAGAGSSHAGDILPGGEIDALLRGGGMGLARVAEENGHPGPQHVLELADALALTAEQRSRTGELRERTRRQAILFGTEIVEIERALQKTFAAREVDRATMKRQVARIALLRGELRAIHLEAHLEMDRILTPEQIATYRRLRGHAD